MKKMLTILMLASMFGAGAVMSANTTDVQSTTKGRWHCRIDKKTGQLICTCTHCGGW